MSKTLRNNLILHGLSGLKLNGKVTPLKNGCVLIPKGNSFEETFSISGLQNFSKQNQKTIIQEAEYFSSYKTELDYFRKINEGITEYVTPSEADCYIGVFHTINSQTNIKQALISSKNKAQNLACLLGLNKILSTNESRHNICLSCDILQSSIIHAPLGSKCGEKVNINQFGFTANPQKNVRAVKKITIDAKDLVASINSNRQVSYLEDDNALSLKLHSFLKPLIDNPRNLSAAEKKLNLVYNYIHKTFNSPDSDTILVRSLTALEMLLVQNSDFSELKKRALAFDESFILDNIIAHRNDVIHEGKSVSIKLAMDALATSLSICLTVGNYVHENRIQTISELHKGIDILNDQVALKKTILSRKDKLSPDDYEKLQLWAANIFTSVDS